MPAPKEPMEPPFVRNRSGEKRSRKTKSYRFSTVLIMAVLAVVVYAVVAHAVQPLFLIHSENSEISVLQKKLDAAREKNRQLQIRKARLRTPEGVRMESRKHGWVKKGEIVYRLNDVPKTKSNP